MDATQSIMSAAKAMATVAKTVTLFNVMAGLTTPIACLAIVLSPCMNGTISNGNSGFTPLSPGEVRGRVVVAVNATANASNSVKAPRTFDGATCTKVNWRRVSMKESSNKVELD